MKNENKILNLNLTFAVRSVCGIFYGLGFNQGTTTFTGSLDCCAKKGQVDDVCWPFYLQFYFMD
jgi:hypothetical protein